MVLRKDKVEFGNTSLHCFPILQEVMTRDPDRRKGR